MNNPAEKDPWRISYHLAEVTRATGLLHFKLFLTESLLDDTKLQYSLRI